MRKLLAISLFALAFLPACVTSSGTLKFGPPPVTTNMAPGTAQSIDEGQMLSVTATIVNGASSTMFTWTVTCDAANCGGVASNMTASGTANTYTAPPPVATDLVVTITATPTSGAPGVLTVTVKAIVVTATTSLTNSPLAMDGQPNQQPPNTTFTATIMFDPSDGANVTWGCAPVGACGSFSLSPTSSGQATSYTSPTVTSPLTVTITATSGTDMRKFFSITVIVNPPPSGPATVQTPPAATVGVQYSFDLMTTLTPPPLSPGTPPSTWTIAANSPSQLPAGLMQTTSPSEPNNINGIISGVPTAPAITKRAGVKGARATKARVAGADPVLIFFICTDLYGLTVEVQVSLTVNPAPLTITTTSLPNGTVGTPYGSPAAGVDVTATGGVLPYIWTGSSNCALTVANDTATGMTNDGLVSGSPTPAGPCTINVTVADSESPPMTMSGAFNITIAAPGALIITTTSPLPNATIGTAYGSPAPGVEVIATGGVKPYKSWTWAPVAPSTAPPGLSIALDPDGDNSGLITGTPPTGSAATYTVSITVTDNVGTTQSGTFSLTIVAPCTPAQNTLCGQFSGLLQGFDAGGFVTMAFSINADGISAVNGGIFDINGADVNHIGLVVNPAPASTFKFDSNNFGTLTLNMPTPIGNIVFDVILDPTGTKGDIIEFDDTTGTARRASGTIQLQDSTVFKQSAVTGGYAYGSVGFNLSASQTGRVGLTGVAISTGAGDFNSPSSGGTLTINNGGASSAAPLTFTGTLTGISSTTGRGTLALTITGGPFSSATLNFAFYILDKTASGNVNKMYFIGIDLVGANLPVVSGAMLAQVNHPSGFTSADVNCGLASTDLACILAFTGVTGGGNAVVDIGRLTQPTAGSLTAVIQENKAGSFTPGTAIPGFTFTVTNAGVVTVTFPTGVSGGPVVIVLSDTDKGFFLEESNRVPYGRIAQQTAVALGTSATTFLGVTSLPSTAGVPDVKGFITLTGATAGNIGPPTFFDITLPSSLCPAPGFCLITEASITGTYSIDGTGLGSGTTSNPGLLSSFDFYTLDATNSVLIETDSTNTNPLLLVNSW